MADFTVPVRRPPASVTPRCSGASVASAQLVVGGDGEERIGGLHRNLVFVEVVVLEDAARDRARFQPSRSGHGSPYFSSRWRSRLPPSTPMRIEQPWSLAAWITSLTRARRCRCCRD